MYQEGKTKVVTLRINAEEVQRADIVFRVEGISVNEVLRRSFECYFEKRRSDPAFVERANAVVARDAELVKEL
jgi:hypothetical protein